MSRFFAVACAVAATTVMCAAHAAEVDPERMAEARALLKALKIDVQMEKMQNAQIDAMRARVTHPIYPPRASAIVMEEMAALSRDIRTRPGGMFDIAATAYAEEFTVDEMRRIRDFYESAVGQRMIEMQPVLMQRSLRQMAKMQEEALPALCRRVDARLLAEKVDSVSPIQNCPGVAGYR